MSFYERFYGFRALSIIGKCTSRHLFAYGGLILNIRTKKKYVRTQSPARLEHGQFVRNVINYARKSTLFSIANLKFRVNN